ncbi:MAG: WG repeat-containing protein [Anaerolineaceae bacterium]|nr:MAG: WG repeat-containing protein [Anaerolineaceae bacterium]
MKKFRILAVFLSCIFILSACTKDTVNNSTDSERSVEDQQEVLEDLVDSEADEIPQSKSSNSSSITSEDSESDENPTELPQKPQNYTKIATIDYTFIFNLSEDMIGVNLDSRYGMIDRTGKEIIAPRLGGIGQFNNGLARASADGVKWGLINKEGEAIVPLTTYQHIGEFVDGSAVVEIGRAESGGMTKYTFISEDGIASPERSYFDVTKPQEGLVAYSDYNFLLTYGREYWGFMDTKGNVVIENKYRDVGNFSEGLAAMRVYGINKWGFIDKTGKEVIPALQGSPYVGEFSEGLVVFEDGNTRGFMDKNGERVIQGQFQEAEDFHDGLAKVKQNGYYGYIDKTGNVVVPLEYLRVGDFSEGLAWVTTMELECGFVDKTGNNVIPIQYNDARDFNNGIAAVALMDMVEFDVEWGFVDKDGNEVIAPMYQEVRDSIDGIVQVNLDGYWGILSKSGEEIIPPKYLAIEYLEDGLVAVRDEATRAWDLLLLDSRYLELDNDSEQ